MPQTFDLILAAATVVNQDGIGVRDIGVGGGRDRRDRRPRRGLRRRDRSTAAACTCCPASSTARCISASPARRTRRTSRPGSRAAVLGGVTAVFEMPNTDPLTVSRRGARGQARAGHDRMHCDFAFWVGGTHDNVADLPELERLPGAAGIKVFMGSSTGKLLVADDAGVVAILQRTRRRAAFH